MEDTQVMELDKKDMEFGDQTEEWLDLLQMLSQESQIVKLLDLLPQLKMVVIKLKKNPLNLLKLNQQQHLK